MPNRILKESICASESLAGLTPRAEVFFYRLIVNCDDYGRMDARTAILRSKCFPLMMEAVSIRDIQDWLRELAGAGLIRCYQWAERPYLELVTWGKHQKIRAKRSKYPGPDGAETPPEQEEDVCEHPPTDADESSRNPNPNPKPNPNPQSNPEPQPGRKAAATVPADGVTLSPDERRKLAERYGQGPTRRMIETLAAYKARSGRVYRSDYRAIINWVARKVLAEAAGSKKGLNDIDDTEQTHAQPGGFVRERFLWKGGDAVGDAMRTMR